MIARKLLLGALVAIALAACSKSPTDAALKAEKDRIAALAKSAQEEEREKDRRMHEEASRTAQAMTAPVSRPDTADAAASVTAAPATSEWRGPGPAPATVATPTAEDKAVAQATGRIRAILTAPESMRIRSPKTREDNAFVCVEIDARNKSGAYGGFVPVIVTREKVLFYRDATKAADQNELNEYLEFVKLNERLKCW